MRSDNNGKVAIAIVGMFVVALSIVGFTYAYFTAQVRGNTAAKSVETTAGRMEVLYTQGNKLAAKNIVPGWISDGIHYYDQSYSAVLVDSVYHITAVTTNDLVTCHDGTTNTLIKNCSDSAVANPTAVDANGVGLYGIAEPVKITVSNTNNNTANNYFIVRLNVDTNTFGSADQENVKVTIKSATVDGSTWTADSVVWSGSLSNTGTQIIVPSAQLLQANDATHTYTKNYLVYLTYVNVNTSQNDLEDATMNSSGGTIQVTADIIGIVENQDNDWVDADGQIISFPDFENDSSNPGSKLDHYIDYTDYQNHNNGI